MAKRSRKSNEVLADTASVPAETPAAPKVADQPAEEASPQKPLVPFVDPVDVLSISLSDRNDGDIVWLRRSNKFQQMQIQFAEKPDEAVRKRLDADGWKWRNEEKIWTKQLERDGRWRTQADAEHLAQEIGNGIRAERGLPPASQFGRGSPAVG